MSLDSACGQIAAVHVSKRGRNILNYRPAVLVFGDDPISESNIAGEMRERSEVRVLDPADHSGADVVVVVVDRLDDTAAHTVRRLRREVCDRVVIVSTHVDDDSSKHSADLGAATWLPRSEASPERLVIEIVAIADRKCPMAPDLLGRMLEQMSRLQNGMLTPCATAPAGFTDREVDVLKLLADGCDTAEIAGSLSYSERTIKNVIRDLVTRLHLKNRSHAVAFAVRSGVI